MRGGLEDSLTHHFELQDLVIPNSLTIAFRLVLFTTKVFYGLTERGHIILATQFRAVH